MGAFQLERKKKVKTVNLSDIEDFDKSILKKLMDIEDFDENFHSKYDDIKKYIFNIYKIQDDLIQNKEVKYKDKIIENLDKIIDILKNNDSLNIGELLTNIVVKEEYLKQMLKKGVESEYIVRKLDEIIKEIEKSLKKDDKLNEINLTNKIGILELDNSDLEIGKIFLDLSKIDLLYKELYESIKNEDTKKITVYRGRIIRELKNNKTNIDSYYANIEPLVRINEILNKKDEENKLNAIKKILSDTEEKKYINYLEKNISNLEVFKKAFEKVYVACNVEKIELYKNALNEELKFHRDDLKQRYSKEFLEKKVTLFNFPIVLANSMGLSISKLNNTINEIKLAKSKRRKNEKIKEALKDLGVVITTPAINIGKFGLDNWYTLYTLHNSYSKMKEEKEKKEETKTKEENKNSKVDSKNEEDKKIEEKNSNESDKIENNEDKVQNNNDVQVQKEEKDTTEVKVENKNEQSTKESIDALKDVTTSTNVDNALDANKPNESSAQVNTEQNIQTEVNSSNVMGPQEATDARPVTSQSTNTNTNTNTNPGTSTNPNTEIDPRVQEYVDTHPVVKHLQEQQPATEKQESLTAPSEDFFPLKDYKEYKIISSNGNYFKLYYNGSWHSEFLNADLYSDVKEGKFRK